MVEVVTEGDASLTDPVLVEGLPGVGLAGKIAADHVRDQLDARYYGELTGEDLPSAAVFAENDRTLHSAIRLFVDEENDLLVLSGDVPLEAIDADGLATALSDWMDEVGATPLYLSGLPAQREPDDVPELYGVATGDAGSLLDEVDVSPPVADGLVQGPAGALLSVAKDRDRDACGLIVETTPKFPDPEGAHVLVRDGIAPLAGVEIDTDPLVESAEEIMEGRKQLAERIQQSSDGDQSRASTTGMFQ
ncbi:proteasome assembly chaperone family protein [Halorarum halophilum]|uniref:Proteasome assembly chaperone family protein n=1 Tax=Halorarum halophilum TaxID=2743090 RepID=A0A7D5GB23_9EURY|nr:PAC2 family protein [Halobaculum halophilum]QLG26985.1 proteasome assembly chaperone family protein [Halobaculum halophilum]